MTLNPVTVEMPQGFLLLDVGFPDGLDDNADALDAEVLTLEDTWAVAVTYQDVDHAGCLAAVAGRTDAVVFAHQRDTPYLEGEKKLVKSSVRCPMEIAPTAVDVRVTGGETFATASGPMRAVYTPGHSPGHTSYYFPDAALLISADALKVVDELVGPREDATPDLEAAWESVEELATLDIETTFRFHGEFVEAGTDRIEELLADW